jgi:Zn finger protein HypA/HybF involved in hydrogenase expression
MPVIEFLCPNGHKISCQAEQAGKAAKCPRCGVKFRIPSGTDLDIEEIDGSTANLDNPDFIDSSLIPAPPNGVVPGKKEPEIEFVCPNGHRLHGPARLQGCAGACPECGSRFKIPAYGDISTEEGAKKDVRVGPIDSSKASDLNAPATATTPKSDGSEQMANLIARLWATLPKGAVVEVGLRNGETFAPDRFLAKTSRESHQGVFATEKADGSVSLAIVAWDAIDRVFVRGLKKLPAELVG